MQILILIMSAFFSLIHLIRKKQSTRVCYLVSYIAYYYSVAMYVYYYCMKHQMMKEALAMSFFILVCLEIILPGMYYKVLRKENRNVLIDKWCVLHDFTMNGFAFWGLLCNILLNDFFLYRNVLLLFVMVYILNMIICIIPEKFRYSLQEMNVSANVSTLTSFMLCLIYYGSKEVMMHPYIMVMSVSVIWVIALTVYTLSGIDMNEGTTAWFLTTKLSKTQNVRYRYKRMGKRFLNIFVPMYFLLFFLMVENTIEFYYVNMNVFKFQIADFWGEMLIQSFGYAIVLSVIGTCLNSKVSKVVGTLLFGVSIAMYIQVMIFNRDIGITDTYVIDWSRYTNKIIGNSIAWIICIMICIVIYVKWNRNAMKGFRYTALFLLVVQIAATISILIKAGGYHNNTGQIDDYYISNVDEFTVSKKNIIIFVLDTFSNDYLDAMLKKYPNELDGLNDFTYYSNYDCKYDGTALAMNYFLTGIEFDNTIPCREYSKKAFHSEKTQAFYDVLKSNGYSCNLYTDDMTSDFLGTNNLYGIFDNVSESKEGKVVKETEKIYRNILKGALYKVLPLGLKKYCLVITSDFDNLIHVENKSGKLPVLNVAFDNYLNDNGLIYNDKEGSFIIYHFEGMHGYGKDSSKDGLEDSAKSNIDMVYKYITYLKKMDVYQDSVIIITADHGQHETIDGIQPIFFLKKANENNMSLRINKAPVSVENVMPTIVDCVNQNSSVFGKTVYDYKETEKRERTVYIRKDITKDFVKQIKNISNAESYTSLYGYTYCGDKEELRKKDENKPDCILKLTDFWQ